MPISAPPALALYRAPVIALVQPAAGGTVPQDKPVVVFRLVQGEASDAIDEKSFTVAIDGKDMTSAFQVAAGEAWGSPVNAVSPSGMDAAAPEARQISARICSERGACGSVEAVVTLAVPPIQASTLESPRASRREQLIDLLLRATKKILRK